MNDGTKDPKLTTVWKCHGCGRSGNAITFIAEHEHISRQQASRMLKELYAPGFIAPKGGSMNAEFNARWKAHKEERAATPVDIPTISWKRYRKLFDADWTIADDPEFEDAPEVHYLPSRGLSPATCEEWSIGYDDFTARLTIPVCDPDGNLVGVKGRAWQDGRKPKYLIIGDKEGKRKRYGFAPYEKSLVVFGLDKWGEQARYVFVEGELDVITLWCMGIPALCTGGASMSDTQAKLIREYTDEIVLFLDNDKAGSNAVWGFEKDDGEHKPGIVELLEPFIRIRIVASHKLDVNGYWQKGKSDRVRRLIDRAEMSYLAQP
jgi:DNA primase